MSKFSLFPAALTEALKSIPGMTATSLADQVKVHRSRISDFIDGGSLPKDETLVSICESFSADHASSMAKAWVRERIGKTLSDAILITKLAEGSEIEKIYASLPTAAMKAFRRLMELAREDDDLRQAVISLAAFSMPEDPKPLPPRRETSYIPAEEGMGTRHSLNEEPPPGAEPLARAKAAIAEAQRQTTKTRGKSD